jgi:hypothetical protein
MADQKNESSKNSLRVMDEFELWLATEEVMDDL